MSKRKNHSEQCSRCLMALSRCFCDQIPKFDLATRVIVIAFKREVCAPSNTGRLATMALTNSVLLARGDPDRPYDLSDHLMPNRPSLVLFPAECAQEMSTTSLCSFDKPFNLIVPDGNWRQASKMIRRDPCMAVLPRMSLPEGAPSVYKIRTERRPGGLATIEAIARALGFIEGAAVQEALEQLLAVKVTRTLASRGIVVRSCFDNEVATKESKSCIESYDAQGSA